MSARVGTSTAQRQAHLPIEFSHHPYEAGFFIEEELQAQLIQVIG